jgi:hypothetical protein
MKLICENYVSPNAKQGTFKNVQIIDSCLTHKRDEKYLAITFEMAYFHNGIKQILATETMGFLGMEADEINSNRTTTISIPNPEFDVDVEGSQERIKVGFFDYLQKNAGVIPADYFVVDYGFPTYEKVMAYFSGGTLEAPEVFITEALAIGFLMNNLVVNGEVVGTQFTME